MHSLTISLSLSFSLVVFGKTLNICLVVFTLLDGGGGAASAFGWMDIYRGKIPKMTLRRSTVSNLRDFTNLIQQ